MIFIYVQFSIDFFLNQFFLQAWLSAFMDGKRCRQKQHDEIAIKRHDTLKQR